jgi:hypothetical protein
MKCALPNILGLLSFLLVCGCQKPPEKTPIAVIEAPRKAQPITTTVKANEQDGTIQKQKAIIDIPVKKLGREFRILGKTGRPLGELMTVQGVVVEGEWKGYDDGPNIVLQRVNGRASQEAIQIATRSFLSTEPDHSLIVGRTYELRGYEDGGYVGTPAAVFEGKFWYAQTSDFHFHTAFVVMKKKEINRIAFSPADFLDRFGVLEGEARSEDGQGYLVGEDWKLLVSPQTGWPNHMERKLVEVEGVMRETGQGNTNYRAEGSKSRLILLEDQLGRKVELKGQAWSEDGHWWFQYRGTEMYVENMEKLPGWSCEQHGEKLVITGTLGEDLLPRIDQITVKAEPNRRKYFIVREASWKPLLPVSQN